MFVEGRQDCVWVTALHQSVKLLYAQASPVKQRSCNSLNPKSMTAYQHARYGTQPLLKNIRKARQIVRVRPDLHRIILKHLLNIRPSGELIHHPPDFAAIDLVTDLCRLTSFPGSTPTPLFDEFVGAKQNRFGYRKAKRPSVLAVLRFTAISNFVGN
jgi:hypothetical protein